MEHTKNFDLLDKQKDPDSALLVTLLGVRETLKHHLNLKGLAMVMRDDNHAALRKQPETENFPYGWFFVNNFNVLTDRQPNKTVGRHALGLSYEQFVNSAVDKAFMFPTELMIEFHYVTNDPIAVFRIMEKTTILSAIDKFSFESRVDTFEWMTSMNLQDNSTPIPRAVLEDPQMPAAFDITFNFRVVSKIGIIKKVAKINNRGEVTQQVGIKQE